MIEDFNEFELTVIKLLHCIATRKRGWTREQWIYLALCEKVLFPEDEE